MFRYLKLYVSTAILISGFTVFCQVNNLEQMAMEYYHLKLSEKLKISPEEFKLYPGVSTSGNTSMWLWNIFNAISDSPGIFYNPAQANNLSQEYVQLLYEIKIQQEEDSCSLQDAMIKYSEAKVKVWDTTIDDMRYYLAESDSLVLKSDTTINYYQQGVYEKQVAEISVSVSFQKSLIFYAYPYSFPNTYNQILMDYKPWFTPCIFRNAYRNIDDTYLSKNNWERFFNTKGVMANICAALVIVKNGRSEIKACNDNMVFQVNTEVESSVLLGVVMYPVKKFVQIDYSELE